jgi:predicted PurR-regulated permease PerM
MAPTKKTFSHKHIQLIFLVSIIGIALFVNILVFWPFIFSLFMATIFSIALFPVYRFFYQHLGKKSLLSAGITLILFIVMILGPISLIFSIFFQEMRTFYIDVVTTGGLTQYAESIQSSITHGLNKTFPQMDFNIHFADTIQQSIESVVQQTGKIFSGVAHGGLHTIIFSFALFYILAHADTLKNFILKTAPLEKNDTMRIIYQIRDSIYGVIQEILFLFSMRLVALIALFSLFGIPNPFFWAMIGALIAVIPGIGMILAIIPSALYFIFGGSIGLGLGILFAGIFCAVIIESILGPHFIENNVRVHPFLILLSMIGGLIIFGAVGFFIGPVFLGLLHVLIEEAPRIYSSPTKKN